MGEEQLPELLICPWATHFLQRLCWHKQEGSMLPCTTSTLQFQAGLKVALFMKDFVAGTYNQGQRVYLPAG